MTSSPSIIEHEAVISAKFRANPSLTFAVKVHSVPSIRFCPKMCQCQTVGSLINTSPGMRSPWKQTSLVICDRRIDVRLGRVSLSVCSISTIN